MLLETIKEVNTKLSRLHVSAKKRPGSVDMMLPLQSKVVKCERAVRHQWMFSLILSILSLPYTLLLLLQLSHHLYPHPWFKILIHLVRNYNVISASKLTLFFLILGCYSKSAKSRTYTVHTPSRKRCIKRITRKTYCSMASTHVNSPTLSKSQVSDTIPTIPPNFILSVVSQVVIL